MSYASDRRKTGNSGCGPLSTGTDAAVDEPRRAPRPRADGQTITSLEGYTRYRRYDGLTCSSCMAQLPRNCHPGATVVFEGRSYETGSCSNCGDRFILMEGDGS